MDEDRVKVTEKERILLIRSRIVVWGIDMTNESYCHPARMPLFQAWEQAEPWRVNLGATPDTEKTMWRVTVRPVNL